MRIILEDLRFGNIVSGGKRDGCGFRAVVFGKMCY